MSQAAPETEDAKKKRLNEEGRSAIDKAETNDRLNSFYAKGDSPNNGYERHKSSNGNVTYNKVSNEGGEAYDVIYDGDNPTLSINYRNPYVIQNTVSAMDWSQRIGVGQWAATRPAYAALEPIDWTDYVPSKAVLAGTMKLGMVGVLLTAKKVSKKTLLFGGDEAAEHFAKHASGIMDVAGIKSYNLKNYISDANWIIQNGTYSSTLNGYYNFIGNGKKGALFGFVGLERGGNRITTFHVKSAKQLGIK